MLLSVMQVENMRQTDPVAPEAFFPAQPYFSSLNRQGTGAHQVSTVTQHEDKTRQKESPDEFFLLRHATPLV